MIKYIYQLTQTIIFIFYIQIINNIENLQNNNILPICSFFKIWFEWGDSGCLCKDNYFQQLLHKIYFTNAKKWKRERSAILKKRYIYKH